MKIIIILFNILLVVNSCTTQPKSITTNKDSEALSIKPENLKKNGPKLKIGPVWYNNESEMHLVYGAKNIDTSENFITELHYKFGGNLDCDNKALIASFDFKNSSQLILPDSINTLLPSAKNILKRKQEKTSVSSSYKNLNPEVLIFAMEKINLKPNSKKNKVNLKISSACNELINLPLVITKYNVLGGEELIGKYIKEELNSIPESKLKNLKVIFSYNQTHKTENYIIDMVNQNDMQILHYNSKLKEYVVTDSQKNIIKSIKRISK